MGMTTCNCSIHEYSIVNSREYSNTENHNFFSPSPNILCVSLVFVYDAVDVSKIVIISSIKLPSCVYACFP